MTAPGTYCRPQCLDEVVRQLKPILAVRADQQVLLQGRSLDSGEPIRQQLKKESRGEETPEQVAKRVRRVVWERVGIERRRMFAHKAS